MKILKRYKRIQLMQKLLLIGILLLSLLAFGCIEQKNYPSSKNDVVLNSVDNDINNDGIVDYTLIEYVKTIDNQAEFSLERQVIANTISNATFSRYNRNISDADIYRIDQALDEFVRVKDSAVTSCNAQLGLISPCSDIRTCAAFCSSNSQSCKRLAVNYENTLSSSILSYVQETKKVNDLLNGARQLESKLRVGTDEDRSAFLEKITQIKDSLAKIKSNPVYSNRQLTLCSNTNFGEEKLETALSYIGNYGTTKTTYDYQIIELVKPTSTEEQSGIIVNEKISKSSGVEADKILLPPDTTVTDATNTVSLKWTPAKPSKEGYMMKYSFTSEVEPEVVKESFKVPDLTVSRVNLIILAPTISILNVVYSLTTNYYISLGASIGITLCIIFILYNILSFGYAFIKEKTANSSNSAFTSAFRRAFGRTEVKWKADVVITLIALIAGSYVSIFVAAATPTMPDITQALDFLLANGFGILGASLILTGVLHAYFTIENIIKLSLMERAYGMVIKQEKDFFLAKAATLKDKLTELKTLIEKSKEEEFDVGPEYDILASINADKLDELARNVTAKNKTIIDDQLSRVENAISSINERKKVAEQNWSVWKNSIAKMLETQGEVYGPSLVFVPNSLRSWALIKYSKDNNDGVVLERDTLKKKKLSPAKIVQDMIASGIIRGAIVIKGEKIALSEFAEGGGTVTNALVLKLRTYMKSLSKGIGQHDPNGFMAVGEKNVIAYIRSSTFESVLFVRKEKFKDAIDIWNLKSKTIEFAES